MLIALKDGLVDVFCCAKLGVDNYFSFQENHRSVVTCRDIDTWKTCGAGMLEPEICSGKAFGSWKALTSITRVCFAEVMVIFTSN